jgi:DNA-directed RNA polymerase specialized sigma24 family protein
MENNVIQKINQSDPNDYLEKVWEAEAMIGTKLYRIQSLREVLTNPCSRLSAMPRNPSPDMQPIDTIAAEIADLEKELDAAIDELVDYKRGVIETLSYLDPLQRKVLSLHYLQHLSWSAIADKTEMSARHLRRVRFAGLKALEHILKKREAF